MATCQFNYGICLAKVGRHRDAARAFLRAYSLNPEDGKALYRSCLALASDDDASGLLALFRQECVSDPEMIQNFIGENRFAKFWELPSFKSLKAEYVV